jgi:hypothetical protein
MTPAKSLRGINHGSDGEKCAGHNSQEHQVSDGQPKCDETDGNSVFSVVPIPFTAAMMVAEMPATIRP